MSVIGRRLTCCLIRAEAHLVRDELGQRAARNRQRDARRVIGRAGARVRLGALQGEGVGGELGERGVGVGEAGKDGLVVGVLVVNEVVNVIGVEKVGVVGGEGALQRAGAEELGVEVGALLRGVLEGRVGGEIGRRGVLPGWAADMALDAAKLSTNAL